MPFVPQPSWSCGILGSTNHTKATFLGEFFSSSFLSTLLAEVDTSLTSANFHMDQLDTLNHIITLCNL